MSHTPRNHRRTSISLPWTSHATPRMRLSNGSRHVPRPPVVHLLRALMRRQPSRCPLRRQGFRGPVSRAWRPRHMALPTRFQKDVNEYLGTWQQQVHRHAMRQHSPPSFPVLCHPCKRTVLLPQSAQSQPRIRSCQARRKPVTRMAWSLRRAVHGSTCTHEANIIPDRRGCQPNHVTPAHWETRPLPIKAGKTYP